MSCREAYKLISLYLDGLVHENVSRQLEVHVAGCIKCRDKLELMKQIPEVLQTDKLLAPSEDFTKQVMQRVVMQQVVVRRDGDRASSFTSYTSTRVTTYVNAEPRQAKPLETADEKLDDDPSAKKFQIINLDSQRNLRRPMPGTYLLRFTSAAAAMVLCFGFVAYISALNGTMNVTSDSSGRAVMAFADLLTSSFSSPWEVAIGSIVAAIIIVTLWVRLVRMKNKG